ncbi:MAG: hypothetical protein KYX64_01930 [Sphingopyxis sp.]|nr:hypothetical protein [Sphingopyxis sp.]
MAGNRHAIFFETPNGVKAWLMRQSILLGIVAALMLVSPVHAKDGPRFSTKTPIEDIAANPAARAVIDAEMPGFTTHPMYEQFKTMSLEALDAMFPGAVPRERIDAVDKALRAIPADANAATPAEAKGSGDAVAAQAEPAEKAQPAETPPPEAHPQR